MFVCKCLTLFLLTLSTPAPTLVLTLVFYHSGATSDIRVWYQWDKGGGSSRKFELWVGVWNPHHPFPFLPLTPCLFGTLDQASKQPGTGNTARKLAEKQRKLDFLTEPPTSRFRLLVVADAYVPFGKVHLVSQAHTISYLFRKIKWILRFIEKNRYEKPKRHTIP